ncbi:MAG: hypothetical protein ACLVIW_10625, partial [Bilophila wadsworthia]
YESGNIFLCSSKLRNVHVGNRHKPIRFLPGMGVPLMSGRVKQYSRELFRDKNSMENMPFGGL